MNNTNNPPDAGPSDDSAERRDPRTTREKISASLQRRHSRERRFRLYGLAAIGIAFAFLVTLFVSILATGLPAFFQTSIQLTIEFDANELDPEGRRDPAVLASANYQALIRTALKKRFPDANDRRQRRALYKLISEGAEYHLRDLVVENPALIGQTKTLWLTSGSDVDSLVKGEIDSSLPESDRTVKDNAVGWIDALHAQGKVEQRFNWTFFTAGDSREPEQAGIRGAIMGSLFTLVVTISLAFPLGVAAAVYLEEFAPKNLITDVIEVNINNLAAVPSIVFGLLGLAVFLNFFSMPRSAPLVGGLVLTLMTLPTIIIASRAALKSVPPSIREAALGMGASRMQMIGHHVLPLALPGMLTGTIIGMAQALGETAPLLMIGMVAFIVDVPGGPLDPATVLPVQIFLWSDLPERAFVSRASAAIIVLLGFLIAMNLLAVVLRKQFERRW